MQKTGFIGRFVTPAATVFVSMVITLMLYHHVAWKIDNTAVHDVLAQISAAILFISIGFGPLLIYPVAFFRGAGTGERIIACLITPLAWNIKEIIRVNAFFDFSETLYYGLNSGFLLCVFGVFAEMGLCELICRWRLGKQSEQPVKVFSPLPVIAIALGLLAVFVFLLWGMGVHFFYIYIEGYKAIFT